MKIEIINFEIKGDERGSLISLEENKNIPFDIKRVYYIFNTVEGIRRGFHAHKKLKQLLVCVSGSCKVLLDDGKLIFEIVSTDKKTEVVAKVIQGGPLKSKKGVNLPNTKVSLPALTEKDVRDALFAIEQIDGSHVLCGAQVVSR